MLTPPLIPEIAKARRDDLLQEVERERLVREARSAEQSFLDRTLAGIGSFLIAAGQKLQEPYISAVSCRSQAYQLRC